MVAAARAAPWAPVVRVVLGQGAVSLTNFITVLALGRWAGQHELGLYALGWSCWFLASSLGDTLVATPYTFHHAQRPQDRPAGDLAMAAAWGTALLGLGAAVMLGAVRLLNLHEVATLWPLLPLAIVGGLLRELSRRHLMTVGQSPALLRQDVTGSALQIAMVAALGWSGHLDASLAFGAMALSSLLVVLPWFTAARLQRLRAAWRRTPAVLQAFFDYGRWLLLGGLCHVASVQLYPWLAFEGGGAAQAGVFAACTALLNLIAPLLTGLTNHFRPRFMQARQRLQGWAFVRHVQERALLFIAPALLLWLMVALGGDTLLSLVYGTGYARGADALVWMGLGTVAVAVAAPLQLGLLAVRAPVTNLLHHGSAVLLLLAGAWLLHGHLTLAALGLLSGVVNTAATLVLAGLFWRHVVPQGSAR